MRLPKKPGNHHQENHIQTKLIAPSPAFCRWIGLQEIPDKEEPQNQAIATESIFTLGNAIIRRETGPLVEFPSPFRIVFNEQNGERN